MKAFVVKQPDGSFLDAVVRAHDADDAKQLLDSRDVKIEEIRSDLADSMGTPSERGRHDGSLSQWIIGPTTILGELTRKT